MFRKSVFWKALSLLAIAVIAVGCSGGGEDAGDSDGGAPEAAAPEAAASAGSSAAPAPAGGGSATGLTGKVTFTGPRPERAVLEIEGDAECSAMHTSDEPLLSEREVVSEDGGVQWAFVYVKNPPEGDYPIPTEPAKLDQLGCRYVPHVIGMRAGQELSIANSDQTLHNVRSIARKNKARNFAQKPGTDPRIMGDFKKPEAEVRMKCDVHPWMTGFVFAMDHPFFAVTDENGNFTINGLPVGEYTVEVWHEKYKKQKMTITVTEGALAETNFAYEPK